MAVATKRDFSISYGLQTDNTGTSTGNTLNVDQVNDRVGVGTTPSYKFHVEAGSAGDYAYMGGSSDNARGLKFSSADDGIYFGAAHTIQIMSGGGSLLFKDDDTDWLKLNQNGNVGVNNTNPAYTLDVSGDINFTGTLYKNGAEHVASRWTLTGSDIYRLSKVGINESNPQSQLAVNGYITESTDSGTTYWNVVTQQDIGTDANQVPLNQYLGQLAFLDDFSPNGLRREGGSSDDVVVDSSGNVGLGTINPNSKLHVEIGKVEISRFTGSYAGNAVNSQTCLLTHPGSSSASGSGSAISIIGGTASATSLFFGDTADADIGSISYLHPTNHMAFTVNANERLRIESDGLIKAGVAFSSTSYGNERFLIDAEGQTNAAADTSLVSIGEDGTANPSVTLYRRTGSTLYQSYAWRITNTLNSLDFKYAGAALPGSHSFNSPFIRITPTGNVGINDTNPDQKLVVAGNIRTTGSLYGPSNFIIDPSTVGDDTGTVEIKGNLVVQGTTTTINSTTVDLDHLSLGDNEVANFGDSDDLQIYHSNGNSYVANTTSGSLLIQGDSIDLRPGSGDTSEVMLRALRNGQVELRYDNAQKFQTTSGGVRIGSATAPIDINAYETLNNGTLSFEGSAGQLFSITNSLTSGSIFSVNDVSGIPSIDVDADGTITLAEFGGSVGVGTASPAEKLEISGKLRIFDGGYPYIDIGISTSNYFRLIHDNPGDRFYIGKNSNASLVITGGNNVEPGADATQDLGSATKRWANIYSADLQLSNEGSHNDVDGTWGKYTIQEGEEDLFLINRRSGKKYKFVLKEV